MTSQAMVKLADELKPCPFCGGECEIERAFNNFEDARVSCKQCGVAGPVFDNDALIGAFSKNPEADATTHWNTRLAAAAASGGVREAQEKAWKYLQEVGIQARRADAMRETCALICDQHAEWAESKIQDGDDPASPTSQMWACMSNTANDLAEMIRKDLPPMSAALTAPPLPADGVREAREKEITRLATIEECAQLIESGAGMADLIDQEELDEQAKMIRTLAPPHEQGEG